MTETPRRINLAAFSPAERAIYDAVQAVEAMAADVRLTDAVILLQAARDSVADYIDNIWPSRRYVSALPASASPHAKGIQRHRYVPDVYVGAACKVCGLEQHHHFHATEPPSARPASLEEPQQPQEQK